MFKKSLISTHFCLDLLKKVEFSFDKLMLIRIESSDMSLFEILSVMVMTLVEKEMKVFVSSDYRSDDSSVSINRSSNALGLLFL